MFPIHSTPAGATSHHRAALAHQQAAQPATNRHSAANKPTAAAALHQSPTDNRQKDATLLQKVLLLLRSAAPDTYNSSQPSATLVQPTLLLPALPACASLAVLLLSCLLAAVRSSPAAVAAAGVRQPYCCWYRCRSGHAPHSLSSSSPVSSQQCACHLLLLPQRVCANLTAAGTAAAAGIRLTRCPPPLLSPRCHSRLHLRHCRSRCRCHCQSRPQNLMSRKQRQQGGTTAVQCRRLLHRTKFETMCVDVVTAAAAATA